MLDMAIAVKDFLLGRTSKLHHTINEVGQTALLALAFGLARWGLCFTIISACTSVVNQTTILSSVADQVIRFLGLALGLTLVVHRMIIPVLCSVVGEIVIA